MSDMHFVVEINHKRRAIRLWIHSPVTINPKRRRRPDKSGLCRRTPTRTINETGGPTDSNAGEKAWTARGFINLLSLNPLRIRPI